MREVRLQPLARSKVQSLGEAGASWPVELPAVLEALADQWQLTLGRALPGGSASYVVGAVTASGEPRVLKVGMPGSDIGGEGRTLVAAGGRGYAHLHAQDLDRSALLLEALGPSLDRAVLPPERKLEVLADTLREAWRVPLETAPVLGRGEDKASSLRRMVVDLDERLGGPCDPRVLTQALEYADRRAAAFDPGSCVVVHGDAHPPNTLRVLDPAHEAPSGYCFVDPDGFRADPAYDLGVALREWTSQLRGADAREVLEGYCTILADRAGVEFADVWEWGFLERVSTGLYVCSFGAERMGRTFLDPAVALLD